jgi:hypothetical protein
VAGEDRSSNRSTETSGDPTGGKAEELQTLSRSLGPIEPPKRTPLYQAQHAARYGRQELIAQYEDLVGASLIVVIDQIFPENLTFLEELLCDLDPTQPLHVLLASPGGDGETAIRMVRSMQMRCSELTMLIPDMAKSAATLVCLGADRIVMGPIGDLGPVDPQFQLGPRSLVSAKEIVEAVKEAEDRITENPATYPLFSGLLSDVNMLMVEQARNALDRTGALVKEALASQGNRTDSEVTKLAEALQAPLIDDSSSHSAVLPVHVAAKFGLPAVPADPASKEWGLIWSLWTRYFALGGFPSGNTAIYEGRRASHVMS